MKYVTKYFVRKWRAFERPFSESRLGNSFRAPKKSDASDPKSYNSELIGKEIRKRNNTKLKCQQSERSCL